jgi:hypothetical protein
MAVTVHPAQVGLEFPGALVLQGRVQLKQVYPAQVGRQGLQDQVG